MVERGHFGPVPPIIRVFYDLRDSVIVNVFEHVVGNVELRTYDAAVQVYGMT
jgi:hypothetical protein